jgi:glycyl-tRNA synthetase
MRTMQDALLGLTEYWTACGCLAMQPMNTEVGAGTLNPATFLRVLGPEPWRVAYVEPSVRPDDSRYGDNPNRIQMHTQFQVILKPEPGNPQDLYMGSLVALGIDPAAHDIRFVEDNWASPALGAWGLGWEVWLDGLEITQFTYFQQAGGMTLDPVSVELTYGMERIMMALQGVRHFKDIVYAPGVLYGEVFGQAEYEMSRYYLDDADIATNQSLFESYAGEARRMLDAGLPVPAYSYVLKCSHTFNVLDSRGAVSTTERARAFTRMRGLAREVGELWLSRREEIGFPLGRVPVAPETPVSEAPVPESAVPRTSPGDGDSGPATLAFEIGVEEMPPAEVTRAVEAVRAELEERFDRTRLRHGPVHVMGSPRRVIAVVDDVHPREDDHRRTIRGPRTSAAFDPAGQPLPAALGFARSNGVDVSDLARVEVNGVEYLCVEQQMDGRPALDVLAALLADIVRGLRSEMNMRWGAPGLSFTRPVRWLVALLGDALVPFSVSSLTSGRTTRVHRAAAETEIVVATAYDLLSLLADHDIIADGAERRRLILDAATGLAASSGGAFDSRADGAVLDEVTNLVERPVVLLGQFEERYLELPSEVLVTVMRKHQRYLPVRAGDDRLLPRFIVVANGRCDAELVRRGNEEVLRARYEDAAFFWRHDLQVPPATTRGRLASLTFEERLGTMADRTARIASIAAALATEVGLSDDEQQALRRAGELAKFDLGSQMVIELPSLAGVMAREYALRAGETEAVATALFEIELPRHAGDFLPRTMPGTLLSLADRFDLLTGLFAIGAVPTGSSDPFGLRRAALGVLGILRGDERLEKITVPDGVRIAAAAQPVPTTEEHVLSVVEFVVSRYEQQLLDAGHDPRHVRAVLPFAASPIRSDARLRELDRCADDPAFGLLAETLQRANRIVPAGTASAYDVAHITEPAELALHQAVIDVRSNFVSGIGSLADFISAAGTLVPAVTEFFDHVLVMADDPLVRAKRLGLLAAVADLGSNVLDWAALD